MTKIIVHIGPHKTGTSALQRFLYVNRKELRERGVIYEPVNKLWNNHHIVADAFIKNRDVNFVSDFLLNLIEENKEYDILLSSEMFCDSAFPTEQFIGLFENVELSVISYIRNPCDLIVSAYNEVVRDGSVQRKEPIDQLPWPYDPSLKNVLRHWLLPGLAICPYDQPQWIGGTLFSDFLSTIKVDAEGLAFPKDRENESLSFPLAEIVRAANIAELEADLRAELLTLVRKSTSKGVGYPLPYNICEVCLSLLRAEMDTYRPFLRSGTREDFLFRNPSHPEAAR